jgi:hypothetical protein
MKRFRSAWLLLSFCLTGCAGPQPGKPEADVYDPMQPDPLPVQHLRAYPEAATGVFLSLADFENAPGAASGAEQVEHFSVVGSAGTAPRPRFVLNITRTGAAALAVTLPPGARLRYDVPHVHDWSKYNLLSIALHTEAARDDLQVTLITPSGSYRSPRRLLGGQWSTVLVDLQGLGERDDFDIQDIQAIEVSLANPGGRVRLGLDDILLIDNRRRLEPTPPELTLRRRGLDWLVDWQRWDRLLVLHESPDGLYRFKRTQAQLQVLGPDDRPDPAGQEDLALLGSDRIGRVRLLEANALRVRLAVDWFFPSRLGQWSSLGVRRVNWQYTFYADGRWVTHLRVNNAGGAAVSRLVVEPPFAAVFPAAEAATDRHEIADLAGPVAATSWQMLAPQTPKAAAAALRRGYTTPGRIRLDLGDGEFYSPGDADRDRFDESAGCWDLAAENGHCRFRLLPPPGGLPRPVFRIRSVRRPVSVSLEGLAVRDLVELESGDVLFQLPGRIDQPCWVEVRSGG